MVVEHQDVIEPVVPMVPLPEPAAPPIPVQVKREQVETRSAPNRKAFKSLHSGAIDLSSDEEAPGREIAVGVAVASDRDELAMWDSIA